MPEFRFFPLGFLTSNDFDVICSFDAKFIIDSLQYFRHFPTLLTETHKSTVTLRPYQYTSRFSPLNHRGTDPGLKIGMSVCELTSA